MSGMIGMVLLVGLIIAGGWCFMSGPCKGMLSGGGGGLTAGKIVKSTPKGKPVPRCGPGTITTPEGCAEAVRSTSGINLEAKGYSSKFAQSLFTTSRLSI